MPKRVKSREEILVVGLERLLLVGIGETEELEPLKQITLVGEA